MTRLTKQMDSGEWIADCKREDAIAKLAEYENAEERGCFVPVVHGRWIEKPFLLGTSNFCSLCDSFYGMPHGKFNYCPNCGARMDGE